jgi:hypothetical protein
MVCATRKFEDNSLGGRDHCTFTSETVNRNRAVKAEAGSNRINGDKDVNPIIEQVECRLKDTNVSLNTAHDRLPCASEAEPVCAGRRKDLLGKPGCSADCAQDRLNSLSQTFWVLLRHDDLEPKNCRGPRKNGALFSRFGEILNCGTEPLLKVNNHEGCFV